MRKLVIKGIRIRVELVIRKISEGATVDNLLEPHPYLKIEEIYAALQYAAAVTANEEFLVCD